MELANKAYTHLFMASVDTIDPAIITDPFIYNITVKLYYTSIVFMGIIINTSISKKSTISYRQFQAL